MPELSLSCPTCQMGEHLTASRHTHGRQRRRPHSSHYFISKPSPGTPMATPARAGSPHQILYYGTIRVYGSELVMKPSLRPGVTSAGPWVRSTPFPASPPWVTILKAPCSPYVFHHLQKGCWGLNIPSFYLRIPTESVSETALASKNPVRDPGTVPYLHRLVQEPPATRGL